MDLRRVMIYIMSALIEYIKQRSVSTLLISYSVFWIVCHWEGVYTTFFTSQDFIMEKYGMLKNEYVHKYFFGISQDNFANWILGIIIPAILAIIWIRLLAATMWASVWIASAVRMVLLRSAAHGSCLRPILVTSASTAAKRRC